MKEKLVKKILRKRVKKNYRIFNNFKKVVVYYLAVDKDELS